MLRVMGDLGKLSAFAELFRSRASLQAEILVQRHQLNVLRRKSPKRMTFASIDRMVLAGLCTLAPDMTYSSSRQSPFGSCMVFLSCGMPAASFYG
jgi:hypothetical protein